MDTHFDKLVDRFESDIQSGNSPQIAAYLRELPGESQQRALVEFISLEVFYQVKQGKPVNTSKYVGFGQTAVNHAEQALKEFNNINSDNDLATIVDSNHANTKAGPDVEPVRIVGRYKLLKKIGEGGMGTVWMAEQEQPVKRRVALKFIKSELASKEIIARFEAERQALAMMNHQNIAKVLDAGTTEIGSPYFVMELVKGAPLTQYCDEHKLSVEARLKLFVPVCKAIQHAHQKGIIHRDLKPSNVLVTLQDGEAVPKVIDFGLAKATKHTVKLTDKTMMTEFGNVVGTLQYMAPEQAELNDLDVDTRSDIYSLGVILYELLTGSTPVDKETLGSNAFLKILEIIREKPPVRPSNRLSSTSHKANAKVSDDRKISLSKLQQILKGDLDWVVMKALEKDRTRRYQTANDFAQDVSNYLNNETVQARPPSTIYRVNKFVRKNKGLVTSLATIAALLLAAVAVSSWFAVAANNARTQIESEKKEVEKQRDRADLNEQIAVAESKKSKFAARRADAEAKRARDSEAAAKFQLANGRWEANRALDARDLLYQIPTEYRNNFEWHFCKRKFQGSDVTCYGHKSWVYKVQFSPDGTQIASASRDQTIKLWDATTGQERNTLKGHANQVGSVAFSPNGKLLASASLDQTIKLWDLRTSKEISTLRGHTGTVATVAFSPNGERIASASDDGTVKLWNTQTGEEIKTLRGHTREVGGVAFSPDGSRIASASVDTTIKIWDANTGEEITTLTEHDSIVISVAFSPDGTRLASASKDTIILWEASSHKIIDTLEGHTQYVHNIAFSPDGTQLASAGRDQTIKLWDAMSGRELNTLVGHTEWVNGVAFSPDGSRLASASFDKTIRIWDLRSGQEMSALADTKALGRLGKSISFSPDGSQLASASSDSTVKLWDARTGLETANLEGHTRQVTCTAFSPDGSQLASASYDNTIKLWDLRTGQVVATLNGHSSSVLCVVFNPGGTSVASASADGTIRLWDTISGKELTTLDGHANNVNCVAFNTEGTHLASASSDGTIKLWDTKTRQEIITLKGHTRGVNSIAFDPHGARLASGSSDKTVKLWDLKSEQEIATLYGHIEWVESVAFSQDGSRLASSSGDKLLKLWDTNTGQELITLKGHSDSVTKAIFSPDGTQLASTSQNSIKIWDAQPKQELTVLTGHSATVTGVTFSNDGKLIYSVSKNDRRIWNVETGKPSVNAAWDPPAQWNPISPDGRWLVTSELSNVILVDLDFKNSPLEKEYRSSKGRYDPWWHQVKAKEATTKENWFAAVFHFSWLLRNAPTAVDFYDGLHSTYQKLIEQSESRDRLLGLASEIQETLELPRGEK